MLATAGVVVVEEEEVVGGKVFREKPIFSKESGDGTDQYPSDVEEGREGEATGCGRAGS